jgi:hypothetical protein
LIRKSFYSVAIVKKCSLFTLATAETDESIQNISGLPQGLEGRPAACVRKTERTAGRRR